MTTGSLYSRPDKLHDAETVLYEVDMLCFARERLTSTRASWSEADEWVYLEAFLLHCRNLIEFFSGKAGRDTDLSISRPGDFWRGKLPEKAVLRAITRPDLWEKYDSPDNQESISKYLHHCTKQRVIKKKWSIHAMYEDLRPVIEKFESMLPAYKPATQLKEATVVVSHSSDGNSTASTRVVDLGMNPPFVPESAALRKKRDD